MHTATRTTATSRQFSHDTSQFKRAALTGPVFITDRGQPAHVLLSYADYQKLNQSTATVADLLAMPGIAELEFTLPRLDDAAQAAQFD